MRNKSKKEKDVIGLDGILKQALDDKIRPFARRSVIFDRRSGFDLFVSADLD